jgi:hypothetical protein
MRPRRNANFTFEWAYSPFAFALAALLITALPTTAASMLRIADDHGGNVGVYLSRYMALRDAREQIVIDGTCSSACTLVLAIVPHDRICVTANAVLGFHAARRAGFPGPQRSWDTNALEHVSRLSSAVDQS